MCHSILSMSREYLDCLLIKTGIHLNAVQDKDNEAGSDMSIGPNKFSCHVSRDVYVKFQQTIYVWHLPLQLSFMCHAVIFLTYQL